MKIRKTEELDRLIAEVKEKQNAMEEKIKEAKAELRKARAEEEELKTERAYAVDIEFTEKLRGADRDYLESYLRLPESAKAQTRSWVKNNTPHPQPQPPQK